MRESRVPALSEQPVTGGLADMVLDHIGQDPNAVLFGVRDDDGTWHDRTAAQFHGEVVALAKGLLAKGIGPGDRVGLMSRTRYEWAQFDYALWSIGACPVPVYPTSAPEQIAWVLSDSGAVACITETFANTADVDSVRDELPGLREIWELDSDVVAELSEAGRDVPDDDVERARKNVDPDEPATIVYTSGTTGRPKGCVLTHRNFLAEVDNALGLLYPVFKSVTRHPPATLVFIPLAHVLGRMLQVACVRAGIKLGHQPSIVQDELQSALKSFRPTFILGVPYVFEKIYNTARHTADTIGRAASFDRSAKIATKYAEGFESWLLKRKLSSVSAIPRSLVNPAFFPGPSIPVRLGWMLYNLLVYRRIRKEVGGRLRYAICGGSPLGRRLSLFFAGAGILIYEGYGLTETTAASTVNPPLAPKFGTVGKPVPGTSIRIADDGEILIKGGQVFSQYWNNAAATSEVLDDEWLTTGDLGELDEDGYLTVTGRKKDILVTSTGKNVAPAPLEDRLRAHPLIEQAIVLGDDRPFVSALITLDVEAANEWARLHISKSETFDLTELAAHDKVRAEIRQAIDEANSTVSRAESIREFRILPAEFSEENGLLTPSMKLRRRQILEVFTSDIEALYAKKGTQKG